MTESDTAIVLIGDVVGSRRNVTEAADWLRSVARELDGRFADDRLAAFAFTQGDELQGLLRLGADPFLAVLATALRDEARSIRWAISVGPIGPGRGPATERSGPAFIAARERLTAARAARDGLVVVTGQPWLDALFDDVAPLLSTLLSDLTRRQRTVASLILVEGLRQADAAQRLAVSRATISVVAGRGRVREIGRLTRALRRLLAEAVGGDAEPSTSVAADVPSADVPA